MKRKPLSKALYRVVVRIVKFRQKRKTRVLRHTMTDEQFCKAISNL